MGIDKKREHMEKGQTWGKDTHRKGTQMGGIYMGKVHT